MNHEERAGWRLLCTEGFMSLMEERVGPWRLKALVKDPLGVVDREVPLRDQVSLNLNAAAEALETVQGFRAFLVIARRTQTVQCNVAFGVVYGYWLQRVADIPNGPLIAFLAAEGPLSHLTAMAHAAVACRWLQESLKLARRLPSDAVAGLDAELAEMNLAPARPGEVDAR